MNIITPWLRTYVPDIPVDDHQLAEDLTLRGIAVEGIHDLGASADGKPNGHLFEMDITTNRVDAMNHYGIAREAATIYNLPLAPLNTKHPIGTLVDEPFPIRIAPEAKGLCGRFTAQVLRNVTIAPSTGAVAEYFNLLGQKLISNVVDASNFVLLAMGHPTHAFDLDKIEGGILVRLAHKGEKLKLLDGTDRTLEPDDLVVADETKALALAGVMGGWDSMITPETKNLLVEAAWFDQASVRRSARRHGLHTDASHRFERGADFNAAPIANALVTKIILQSAGAQSGGAHSGGAETQGNGEPEGELIDLIDPEVAARTASRPPIGLSVKQVQRHLGATLDDTPTHSALTPSLIHQYLTSLGCILSSVKASPAHPDAHLDPATNANPTSNVNPATSAEPVPNTKPATNAEPATNSMPAVASRYPEASSSGLSDQQGDRGFSPWGMPSSTSDEIFSAKLPSWRLDLEREIDLIEEVARVYGYNRFANTLPAPGVVLTQPTEAKEAAVRTRLLALGFSESISTTFASQSDADLFYTAAGLAKETSAPEPGINEPGVIEPGAPSFAQFAKGAVPLENPLSEEASLLRPTLIPGMVTMLSHNLNRDVKEVRLFEQGHIFTATIPADANYISEVHELPRLSLGLTTAAAKYSSLYSAEDAPFFELKGAIESLLSLFDLNAANAVSSNPTLILGKDSSSRPEAALLPPERRDPRISPVSPLTFTAEAPAWLQPGRSATVLLNNHPIAHFGELAHTQREARKLRQPLYLAQLDLAALYALPLKKVTAHDLSRYQAVERDFSFVFPDATQWQTVSSAIHALSIPELQSLKPIEVFRDQKKYPGVYSLLLRTVFQSNDCTLREEELTGWWTRIIAALTALGGTLRDGAAQQT